MRAEGFEPKPPVATVATATAAKVTTCPTLPPIRETPPRDKLVPSVDQSFAHLGEACLEHQLSFAFGATNWPSLCLEQKS